MSIFADIELWVLLTISFAALATGAVHGASGVAGGFLMSAVLASVIGVKPVVPIMSVALLISHTSRVFLNARDFDRTAFLTVVIPAMPCVVLTAILYGKLSSAAIAIVLGAIVLISIPMRRWAKKRQIKAGKPALASAGAVYGAMAGTSVGPGMLLIPFLLGFGLAKEAFVATMAAIALSSNITRLAVFGNTTMLDSRFILLGIVVGLITIPGNWIGRNYLRKMTNKNHSDLVDVLTIIGAANFFWLAFNQ